MPKRLDWRLRAVAELRQKSIKCVREWRDGANQKWFDALRDMERENIRRVQRGERQLGCHV